MSKSYILLCFLMNIFTSCHSQSQLEDGRLDLEKLNFKTFNAKKYFEKSSRAELSELHSKYKSGVTPIYYFQSVVDTINFNGDDYNIKNPYAIVYRQTTKAGMPTWAKDFNVCFFKNLSLNAFNAITNLKNEVLLISGEKEEIEFTEIEKFIENLNKQYGQTILIETSTGFFTSQIRKWKFQDHIISLISEGKVDFKGKMLSDKQKELAKHFENKKTGSVTIFICNKDKYREFKDMDTRIGFMTAFEK